MTEVPGGEPIAESYSEPMGEPIIGSVAEAPVAMPAAVAEAAPAAEPAPVAVARPTDVVVVTLMALLAGLGDVIAGTAWLIERDSTPDGAAYLAWAALLIGLGTTAVAAMLFIGSRIARTLIGLFMIIRIAFQIYVWWKGGSDFAVAAMIQILISGVVLILLFSRESTAYLTGVKK